MYGYRADKLRTFWSVPVWESAEILHRTHRKIQTLGVSPAALQKSDAPNAPSSMIAARHCGWSLTAEAAGSLKGTARVCFRLRIQPVSATFYALAREEDVANGIQTEDLLYGSSEGVDVGSLANRRFIGNHSPRF